LFKNHLHLPNSIKISEKSKRKKQSASAGKPELVYKRVYIWELDDLFGDEFNQQMLYNPEMKKLIGQLLSQCFQLNATDVSCSGKCSESKCWLGKIRICCSLVLISRIKFSG
jgi:hypothetical protein